MGAANPRDSAAAAAGRFISWLARSTRAWLVVLDDLADPVDAEGLWPRGPAGRVLVTTRRRDAAPHGQDVRVVQVGGFSLREALAYLTERLTDYPDQRIEALDLAEELGRQPLGLACAAALMTDSGIGCRDFRLRYGERIGPVAVVMGKNSSTSVVACWSLAVERANELVPAGLAWPALALAALLDPNGIPGQVLTSPAACAYITGHPGTGTVSDLNQVRAALRNLARLGLVTIDPGSTARTVRSHSFVWSAVRKYLPAAELDQAVRAAGGALLHSWPDDDLPLLGQALRDCTARLREIAGERLWNPEGHPVLFRAGQSLDHARLTGPAIAYWQMMTDASSRILGVGHAQTALARGNLAAAYEAAGRPNDAITVLQSLFAERKAKLGPRDPATLATSASLAHAYRSAGRPQDAIVLYERTLADQVQVLGTGHPDTLAARASLASAYQAAGRMKDAIVLYERILADRERVQGPDHLDTLTACGSLASAYHSARRLADAIPLYERTLAGFSQVLGPAHPDTLTSRANLASAYHTAGRNAEAVKLLERALADCEKAMGPRDPMTRALRENLAAVRGD